MLLKAEVIITKIEEKTSKQGKQYYYLTVVDIDSGKSEKPIYIAPKNAERAEKIKPFVKGTLTMDWVRGHNSKDDENYERMDFVSFTEEGQLG